MKQITVFLDVRCLQDPRFRHRGIGSHVESLLRSAGRVSQATLTLVAMADPALPPLAMDIVTAVDAVVHHANPVIPRDGALFVAASPMTHQPSRFMRLVGHDRVVTAALVYDFIPYDLPYYLDSPGAAAEYESCVAWLKLYDLFFPISQFSAARLRHYMLVPEGSSFVTGCALRPSLVEVLRSDERKPDHSQSASQPYFVLATGDDKRKNSEVAVKALAALHARGRRDVSMKVLGLHSSVANRWISQVPPSVRGAVEVLSDLSDSELHRLYSGAVATIVPSRMEGFSLPVVESVACGTPAIASDVDAHRELIRGHEALFDPADPAALATRMEDALDDRAWRERMIESQRPAATNADPECVWQRFWKPLLEAFEHRVVRRLARGPVARRPRIALVTPFPPDQSGVARYSEDTVSALAKLCDVSVFTDASRSEPRRPLHPLVSGWIDVGALMHVSFDAVILVAGNSPFHHSILDLCERYGGPTILHDARLTQIYADRWGRREFRRRAEVLTGQSVTDEDVEQWRRDENPPSLFLEPIIKTAHPLIVHTEPCRGLVKRFYGVEPALVPFATASRLSAVDFDEAGRAAARTRIGVAPGTILLSTFGYVDQSKGTADCVRALRHLRDANIAAELHIVGSNQFIASELTALTNELRLSHAVRTYPGFVGEDLYADYLRATDIGIQLRTYGVGQFSAALAECIASGMACVASTDLAEACEAPSYVRRIPMGADALRIAEAIRAVHDSGAPKTRLHGEREDFLERHSFGAYAERLLAVLDL